MDRFWAVARGGVRGGGQAGLCGVLLSVLLTGMGCSTDGGSVSAPGAAGDCTGGGVLASGNGCAGGSTSVKWATSNGKYALTFGNTYLEIDPAYGARVTALRVGGSTGQDLIADSASTEEVDSWGSTFWPSPQSTWNWPPIAAINEQPYAVVSDESTLTLTSAVSTDAPTVSVSKKFSVDPLKDAIVIEYTMTNGGSEPVSVAPWEITRVAAGGLTFYAGSGAPFAGSTFPLMASTDEAGATWYQHDPSDPSKYKLLADGQGWLAHATGDLLLIKSFPDISPADSPAGEAEIEIFAAPKYVEVEQQGALETLAPGQSLHWTVRWYVRKLAAPAAVGSADLVRYIQNQIK